MIVKQKNTDFVSADQKNKFTEDGFFVARSVFDKNDLEAFKYTLCETTRLVLDHYLSENIEASSLNPHKDLSKALLFLRRDNQKLIALIQRAVSRSPEFFRLSSDPKVVGITRQCLNLSELSPLYTLSNGVVFQTPNDKDNEVTSNIDLDWHNDIFYTIPKSLYLHVWSPLFYNADEEIGTLIVCPGSHKEGINNIRFNPDAKEYNRRYFANPDVLKKYKPVSVDVDMGDVLFFDHRLLHKSGDNTSDQVRCTLLGLYHDVSNPDFQPVSTYYLYHKQTPEGYYAETFNDDKARSLAGEMLVNEGEPKGGV